MISYRLNDHDNAQPCILYKVTALLSSGQHHMHLNAYAVNDNVRLSQLFKRFPEAFQIFRAFEITSTLILLNDKCLCSAARSIQRASIWLSYCTMNLHIGFDNIKTQQIDE